MPVISGNYQNKQGVLVRVIIQPILPENSSEEIHRNFALYMALFDTGASSTCISDKVVAEQRLDSLGKTPLISATESKPTDVYTIELGFPLNLTQKEEAGEIGGEAAFFHDLRVVRFNNERSGFDVLIGRDVIGHGVLNISCDGHFTFAI